MMALNGPPTAARHPLAAATTTGNAPVAVALGSSGGTGLNGGAISLGLSGDTTTTGSNATGTHPSEHRRRRRTVDVIGASELAVTVGGSNGASGNGGDLNVTNAGTIATTGSRAHGIFLQSIGGGGAAVFTDVANPTIAKSSDNTGNGGTIDFTQTGDISTQGDHAYGLSRTERRRWWRLRRQCLRRHGRWRWRRWRTHPESRRQHRHSRRRFNSVVRAECRKQRRQRHSRSRSTAGHHIVGQRSRNGGRAGWRRVQCIRESRLRDDDGRRDQGRPSPVAPEAMPSTTTAS